MMMGETEFVSSQDSQEEPREQENKVQSTSIQSVMDKMIKRSQGNSNLGQELAGPGIKELMDRYKNKPVADLDSNPLDYWKNLSVTTDPLEKSFCELAKKYLTPPPTSVSVERLFSVAGSIRSQKRNKLTPENCEMLLFVKENLPKVHFTY